VGCRQKETAHITSENPSAESRRSKRERREEEMTSSPLSMPIYIFVDMALACQCTKADAPIFKASYEKLFKKSKVVALTALEASRQGYSIPKSRFAYAPTPTTEDESQ